jgi:predicted transglutaminase-like cysteine proteinase
MSSPKTLFCPRPAARRASAPAALLLFLLALVPCPALGESAGEHLLAPHPSAPIPAPDESAELLTPLPASPVPAAFASPPKTLLLLGNNAFLLQDAPSPEAEHVSKRWRQLLARHDPAAAFSTDSRLMPVPVLKQWQTLTARLPAMKRDEELRGINGFFNNWASIPDNKNYAQEEYWALPEEFLSRGGGDCEDFAIIKYLALRWFSWPAEDLWIVLLHDRINRGRHAVLAARVEGRIFILDNLSRPAHLLIPEKQYAGQVTPMYALNELGVWLFAGNGEPEDNVRNQASASGKKRENSAAGRTATSLPR